MNYITVKEVAEKWGISERRVRALCSNDQIEGAKKQGKIYLIPKEAKKPRDGRRKVIDSKYIEKIDEIDKIDKSIQEITLKSTFIEKVEVIEKIAKIDKTDKIENIYNSIKETALKRTFAEKIDKIDKLMQEFALKRQFTSRELEKINEDFLIDFTYNSNAIEGNTLMLKETALVLEGSTIDNKSLKDHLKVAGHRDAYKYVEDISKINIKTDEKMINDIHALVLMSKLDDNSKYRNSPTTILGEFKEMTPPELIVDNMKKLLKINDLSRENVHNIERMAWFHLAFENIHPFLEGNGRTGRLLLNLDLIQNGYPPISIKFANRKRYYKAFEDFFENEDITPMVNLICECIQDRINGFLKILDE